MVRKLKQDLQGKGEYGIIATAMIRAEVRMVLPYHDAEHMV